MERSEKIQNVNLYLPELRPKHEWMSSRVLVVLSIGVLIVLTATGLFGVHQVSKFEATVVELESQAVVSKQRITDIKGRAPAGNSIKLAESIAQLRAKIASRIVITDLIEGQSLGNELGYSERMNHLGYAVDQNTAIERVRFSRGANYIEIQGESTNPAGAAELAESLRNFSSYQNVNFGELSIAEKEFQDGVYRFSYGFEALYDFNSGVVGVKN